MSFIPKPHEIYKHFKGNLYQVTAIAEHTETGEQLVIYQDLYDQSRIYARPLSMFISKVDRDKYPGAEQEFRFQLQGPDAERQRAESRESTGDERMGQQGYSAATVESQKSSASAEEPQGKSSSTDIPQGTGGFGQWKDAACETADKGGLGHMGEEEPAQSEEEPNIDPFVLEFLDSDSYEQKLNILAGLHHRITDEMITTMAIACDVEINDGDIEERYEALKTCLLTMERYECNRLR